MRVLILLLLSPNALAVPCDMDSRRQACPELFERVSGHLWQREVTAAQMECITEDAPKHRDGFKAERLYVNRVLNCLLLGDDL